MHNGYPTNSPLSGGTMSGSSSTTYNQGGSGSSKGEVYNIRTDNILFIFTGAFIGMHKIIMDRVSKGSIGFGAPVRAANSDNQTSLKGGTEEAKLFEKYLPFFTPNDGTTKTDYNPLDLLEPSDLQKYGLIPELVGRIPVSTALSALDEEALVRVLTEPRNSLMRQYEQLFQLSGVELRLTSGALREVAKAALGMGTGARGLRTVMERLLGDAMFEAPGQSVFFLIRCAHCFYPSRPTCNHPSRGYPSSHFHDHPHHHHFTHAPDQTTRLLYQIHPRHRARRPEEVSAYLPSAWPTA